MELFQVYHIIWIYYKIFCIETSAYKLNTNQVTKHNEIYIKVLNIW